ncbi:gas vesicle protein GvpO [Streptomyces odontomachi]|uniref:gas vesicle protein GvpO n=1 Tax=Streptomyces odontomachi TaxID=2944940 RepID=UPI002109318F|nr:gas vesicle protein [Streptomyces sp. ODS25]
MPNSKHHETNHENSDDVTDEPRRRRPASPMRIHQRARAQLAELLGRDAESVSSFEQSEDGWTLEIEVVEMARIPDTMSLMGSYRVQVNHDGELMGYRRLHRYERGRAEQRR